jgi:hypothetical protein
MIALFIMVLYSIRDLATSVFKLKDVKKGAEKRVICGWTWSSCWFSCLSAFRCHTALQAPWRSLSLCATST